VVDLAELMVQRTAYARERLGALKGVSLMHEQPVVREFAVHLEAQVGPVIERCRASGVNPGVPLGPLGYGDGLLIAITEQRARADIDRLADVLGAALAAERPSVEARA
jgi:glycine dehydrogenase subunit 1